jgi:hypothetical protein
MTMTVCLRREGCPRRNLKCLKKRSFKSCWEKKRKEEEARVRFAVFTKFAKRESLNVTLPQNLFFIFMHIFKSLWKGRRKRERKKEKEKISNF